MSYIPNILEGNENVWSVEGDRLGKWLGWGHGLWLQILTNQSVS